MTLRRSSSWYRVAALACCVVWACQDSPDPSEPTGDGAAGAAGTAGEGGASGSPSGGAGGNAADADAGAGGAGVEGGHGGASTTNEEAGSPGSAGEGGAASAGEGGVGGCGGNAPDEATAGAGGTSESESGPPLRVIGGELLDGPPPDPKSPKLVPLIEELIAEPSVTNGSRTVLRVRTVSALEPPRFIVALADGENHYVVEAARANEESLYEIGLVIARAVRDPLLTVRIAPMDARGNIGPYQNVIYSLTHVGRGHVIVTLSIDQRADLDLSVVEPSGFEISYQLPLSPTGGRLDFDSNAACEFDGADSEGGQGADATGNIERVSWPRDFGPTGLYEVYVKNYDDCGVAPLTFTVTVLNGSTETTHTGHFPKDSIGESVLVTKFEHY